MTANHSPAALRQFNEAAPRYHAAASWQQETAQSLYENIDKSIDYKKILDLGCGTGHLTKYLETLSADPIISLDFAINMLCNMPLALQTRCHRLCAQAGTLPFAARTIDLATSNLLLHWCPNLTAALAEQARVLKPTGQLHASLLGENSLSQLKAEYSQFDTQAHAHTFPTQAQVRAAIDQAGLCLLSFNCSRVAVSFDSLRALNQHFKQTGTHNHATDAPRGLMGKAKWRALAAQISTTLEFEVFYIQCSPKHS